MPRAAQVFKALQSPVRGREAVRDKMPDSSAGDSPRSQPAKPVTPSLPVPRPNRSLFSPNNDDISRPRLAPKSPMFFKKGSFGEAVREAQSTALKNKQNVNPKVFNRGNKWNKKLNTENQGDGWLGKSSNKTSPVQEPLKTNFYSPSQKTYSSARQGLSEREPNIESSDKKPESDRKIECVTIDGADDNDDKPLVSAVSPVKSLPEKCEPHKVGLQNKGNTCYLNSTVQALLGLPMVVTDANNLRHALLKRKLSTENSKLVVPFTSLCLSQSQGDVTMTNNKAVEVKQDMEQLDGQFAGHKMQDANEFLCRFMDELKENIGKMFDVAGDNKELEVEDDCGTRHTLTNLVDTNFQYEKREQFVCTGCGHQSYTKYTDVNFFLDLSDASLDSSVSIQQLVEQTLAPEVREKRCEECGCETATTTTQLTTMPKVMLLYLKRYKFMGTMGGGTMTTTSRKVTRLVDIFDSLSLEKVVSSDVSIPQPVLAEPLSITSGLDTDHDSDQVVSSVNSTQSPPVTPVKNNAIALPFQGVGTPIKFKGKTEEELSKLSEEEQTEYLIYISQKETMTSAGREDLFVADEDEDLKAALEASLLDVTNSDNVTSAAAVTSPSSLEFKTPPRKRHQSVTSSDSGYSPPPKVARHSGGVFSSNTDTLLRREATPTPDKMNTTDTASTSALPDSPALGSSPEKKQSWKKNYHRPETKAEEDADFERALELSTQDFTSAEADNTDACVPESSDSVLKDDDHDEPQTGPAELCYKLSSIVSHFGASTTAGHYVADVYRFDAGGWFRYDDTNVTETNAASVRKGSNRANGYIFMYVHSPLWDQCNLKLNKNLNNNNIDPLLCDSSV